MRETRHLGKLDKYRMEEELAANPGSFAIRIADQAREILGSVGMELLAQLLEHDFTTIEDRSLKKLQLATTPEAIYIAYKDKIFVVGTRTDFRLLGCEWIPDAAEGA